MSRTLDETVGRTTSAAITSALVALSLNDLRCAIDRCSRAGTPGPDVARKLFILLGAMYEWKEEESE